jgi:hypothetical protein
VSEVWEPIPNFEDYSISSEGRVRSEKSGRILCVNQNQYGLVYVGLMQDGIQKHRSVPLLVAKAFIENRFPAFDTPINLNGDRFDNRIENLVWRPRWFAIKYNKQFREDYVHRIFSPVVETESGDISENSWECAIRYGLLEEDLVLSILNYTYVWPTYKYFQVLDL